MNVEYDVVPEVPEVIESVVFHRSLGIHPLDGLYCTLQFIVTCVGWTTVSFTGSVEQWGPESEIPQKHFEIVTLEWIVGLPWPRKFTFWVQPRTFQHRFSFN